MTSATSSDSRSAFTKPLDVATGSVSTAEGVQRLLLRSWSARCLATRQVTQDNRGKRTPGVDGVASLTPEERLTYAHQLRYLSRWTVDLIRRTYIPKPNNPSEKRGLGIPTLRDRAMQALVKLALEPEWEAVFEPNSYGFRPGRSTHDAIEAIFNFIRLQPKYVLDADIEKCFDRISQGGLLAKLHAPRPVMRLIRDWLKTVKRFSLKPEHPKAACSHLCSPTSPCMALRRSSHATDGNIASWSFAMPMISSFSATTSMCCWTPRPARRNGLLRWACNSKLPRPTHLHCTAGASVTHTLNVHDGHTGFDFLGFHIRQSGVGKYRAHKRHAGRLWRRRSSDLARKPCNVTCAN
jgi:RNA-directed DNA polymerase